MSDKSSEGEYPEVQVARLAQDYYRLRAKIKELEGMSKPMFIAANAHAECSGPPPQINANDYRFSSFFTNEHGEQWIFVYDEKTDTGIFRGGDIEWEEVRVASNAQELLSKLIMSKAEQLWVQACFESLELTRSARRARDSEEIDG